MAEILERYKPLPAPNIIEELPRYLEQELNRIGDLMFIPDLNYTIVEETAVELLTATPTWARLYEGITEAVDYPDMQWDPVTATWTAVEGGIYNISSTLDATAPGSGNKDWALGIATIAAGARREALVNGSDGLPLTISNNYILPLSAGDTVYWEWAAVVDTPSGATTTIDAFSQVWRLR